MKAGVSSYSFNRLVKSKEITFLQVVEEAKKMGFEGIEFSGLTLPEGETAESFAPKVREECEKHQMQVINYPIGADFLNGSGGDLKKEIERVCGEVKIAHLLGAPCMRHDATRGFPPEKRGARGFDAALPTLAKGCREVTKFAADLGVKTTVENHGFFCQDSDRVEKLVDAVDNENFGVLIDMGNFLCADEDPVKAVGRLAASAHHLHAKDFHVKSGAAPYPGQGWMQTRAGNYLRGSIIGHGDVPVTQCLRIMKKAGYDGWCSIEFEGMEDVRQAISLGLANLNRFIDEAGK